MDYGVLEASYQAAYGSVLNYALDQQQLALSGSITGLAAMTNIMNMAAGVAKSGNQFVEFLQGVFIPNWIVGSSYTPGISKSRLQGPDNKLTLKTVSEVFTLPMTGWGSYYTDTLKPSEDQSHHLVAFVVYGFGHPGLPEWAQRLGSSIQDSESVNPGDHRLGVAGLQFGTKLYNIARSGNAIGGYEYPEKLIRQWVSSVSRDMTRDGP